MLALTLQTVGCRLSPYTASKTVHFSCERSRKSDYKCGNKIITIGMVCEKAMDVEQKTTEQQHPAMMQQLTTVGRDKLGGVASLRPSTKSCRSPSGSTPSTLCAIERIPHALARQGAPTKATASEPAYGKQFTTERQTYTVRQTAVHQVL